MSEIRDLTPHEREVLDFIADRHLGGAERLRMQLAKGLDRLRVVDDVLVGLDCAA